MTVSFWAWAAFAAFVVLMLVLDLFVLHRRAHEVALREAGLWSAVWVGMGLGFAGLLWLWQGGGTAQAYLAGYLIEKSLSLDNVFVFAVIFSAFAVPARYQHRVLMAGIVGALLMRGAFIAAGLAVLEVTTSPFVIYTSNVFALLGMRALYFLLTGAAARFRYLRPGLAVILAGIAVKLLVADLYTFPTWASPAFIAVVLAVVTLLSA